MSNNYQYKSRAVPKHLSKLLDKVIDKSCKKRGFGEKKILLEWKNIIGEEIADYCSPQKISYDSHNNKTAILHVNVASSHALQVQHIESVILDRISTYIGYRLIKRIVIHQY